MATAQLETPSQAPKHTTLVERWFFIGVAIAMIVISVAGFMPLIANPAERRAPLSLFAAAHGTVFLVWLLLFLAQTLLVPNHQVNWHRRLGLASTLVFAVMLPLGYATTIAMARRGFDLSGDLHIDSHPHAGSLLTLDAVTGSVFNFCYLAAFALLTIAAICYRRKPAIHKRLMLFANIELIGAPMGHLLGHANLLTPAIFMIPLAMFLFAAVARDYLVERRIHPLSAVLAMVILILQTIKGALIGPSPMWHHFVAWLIE